MCVFVVMHLIAVAVFVYVVIAHCMKERERETWGGEKVSKANCYLFHEVLNDWKLPDTICFPC